MKNQAIKYKYLLIMTVVLTVLGCSDYLDVDTDTDAPTNAPIDQLLPGVELGVKNFNDYGFYGALNIGVYTHQFVVRESPDQYGMKPSNTQMTNEWDNLYLTLTDLESLIVTSTEKGNLMYAGIGQMLKAYLMAGAVDTWGSVPYSEATKLEQSVVSPHFDEQEAIYQSVLKLIDSAKVNMASDEGIAPGQEDLFYEGNMEQWVRFANSYKLKLYNQIQTTSLYDQSDVDALISEDNFMQSIDDDFEFVFTTNQAPTDERNRLYLDSYGSTQFTTYISPWMYEILKGWNPSIFTGIEDPRIPYYWVNQLADGEFPPDQGNVETGDPNADYWDASTGFFSIRFGSIGPDRDHSVENSVTYPGIFPAGGVYDENTGYTMDINSGTGVAPHRMFTYDEFLYVQAEMMLNGLIPGSAKDKLEEAMTASFLQVDDVVAKNGTSQEVPELSGSEEVENYISRVLGQYEGASDEKRLEIIMTEKWVSTFGDTMDQYTDYRRTGYPVLADPRGDSKEYQLDMGAFPLDPSLTVLNNEFQISIFWPQSELNSNANAPAQKNPATYAIFWDN